MCEGTATQGRRVECACNARIWYSLSRPESEKVACLDHAEQHQQSSLSRSFTRRACMQAGYRNQQIDWLHQPGTPLSFHQIKTLWSTCVKQDQRSSPFSRCWIDVKEGIVVWDRWENECSSIAMGVGDGATVREILPPFDRSELAKDSGTVPVTVCRGRINVNSHGRNN
jgi:hypothetical protein